MGNVKLRTTVKTVGAVRVRCLGPCDPPHFLWSLEASNRVCPRCRKVQDAMRLAPLVDRPVRVADV